MAFKDLFNNYFYGKPGREDFTQDDLPETRRQLFFQVLRVRWGSMVGLNLLYLLFWLPAAVWSRQQRHSPQRQQRHLLYAGADRLEKI